jgi:hypothetical protein
VQSHPDASVAVCAGSVRSCQSAEERHPAWSVTERPPSTRQRPGGAPERLLGKRSSWNPRPLSVSFPLGDSLALEGGQGRGEGEERPALDCARRCARGLRQPATLSPWQRMAVPA